MNSLLIKYFCDLVGIDSPTGHETQVGDYLYRFFDKRGNKTIRDNFGNLYVLKKGEDKFPPVFLSAHMDTVGPGRGIKPVIHSGLITSNGKTILGADNKVAIAALMEMVDIAFNENLKHRTFELIFTRSEESGNYGALNFDYSLLKSLCGYCFDSASDVGTIILSSPFYERFDLELIGLAAHASKPDKAINVLNVFTELMNRFPLGQLGNETIINIGCVKAGDVRNTIPGEMILKGEIRSFSEKKLNKYKNIFSATLNEASVKYRSKYHLEYARENSGYQHMSTKSTLFIDTIKKTLSICGIRTMTTSSWGVSDANIFNDRGLLCVNLGYGAEYTHTVRERIKISEMKKLTRLILKLITL